MNISKTNLRPLDPHVTVPNNDNSGLPPPSEGSRAPDTSHHKGYQFLRALGALAADIGPNFFTELNGAIHVNLSTEDAMEQIDTAPPERLLAFLADRDAESQAA